MLSHLFITVEATITQIEIPENVLKGSEATMRCTFDDEFSNIVRFYWSSSAPEVINRNDADELASYNHVSDVWTDFTSGRFTATMDRVAKSSNLILETADLDDQKKYWCIVQVFGTTFEETDIMNVNGK